MKNWQSIRCDHGMARAALALLFSICLCADVTADENDWTRFLGTDGTAVANNADVPTHWNANENIKWKSPVPGPGASSPIVLGDRVFLTCYSGYGDKPFTDRKTSDASAGQIGDLTRHLICFDRSNGNVVWQKLIDNNNVRNEDPFKSYITYHGYATNTPVTDGESIFAFFGKAGVIAFDLEGNELWRQSFEGEPNETRWGSASSPVFYGDYLIVNAIDECGKIIAINKGNGEVIWEFDAQSRMAYSTPGLVKTADGKTELVVAIPEKVYGINPDNGKQLWHARTTLLHEVNATIMVEGDIAFIYGGYQGVGSLAVRAGGEGDVTDSHVLWTSNDTSYVSTPVMKDQHIFWVNKSGLAFCVDAENGERKYRQRVPGMEGGQGIKIFASMVRIGDQVYAVSQTQGTFVWSADEKGFNLVSHNVIEGDESDFNGTPAISRNQMFIRSNKFLYCISN